MSTFQIDFGEDAGPIVGIDLGTTNSLVAHLSLTGPRILGPIVPSIVAVQNGELVAGEPARAVLLADPSQAVYSAKRLMGRGAADVAEELSLFPFRLASGSEQVLRLVVGDRTLTPSEIGAQVLRALKVQAESELGRPVAQAVVTVPAYFNDAQRQATKDAGRLAGLDVLRLVNEPTAAALAYGLDKRKSGTIAVYDLGGGTFDISILKLHDGIFEVLATNGDTHLGGDDIDNLLMAIAMEDLGGEPIAAPERERLRREVIAAKEELSFVPISRIDVELGGRRYQRELTRELFEKLIAPIVERTMAPCRACLKDSGLTVEQIDEVVLVGGSTRIPLVRQAVRNLFRAEPHVELNPDEVVALGAAVQAGILAGDVQDTLLLDVTPLSLGIETMGGVVSKLIHRNSTIPASATEQFTTSVDGQRNVLIHVLQGERELVKDCRSLARFELKDLDPLPAGLARIEVKFTIDANGILNVTARDARSGRETTVEVKPSYGLTDAQVEAMILESITHAEDDFRERQVRESRVEADNILAATEKAKQSDAWFDLSEEERAAVDRAVNELLMAYHSSDHHVIQRYTAQLNEATMALAENMMNTAVQGALKGTKI
ncbi:MAG: Fe-S protein assembly chaperone HscA [Bryobacteraceae bacterium]|nr:Fe-S protein assembly chaperone HscA [Bryobacteraceae bacterium]